MAATVVQPDIRVGASYIDVENFSPDPPQSESGGQIDALIRFSYVDDQTVFSVIPLYMQTFYSGAETLEREEQRLTVNWSRIFKTADINASADYSRKDLFSSEFEDLDTDPNGEPTGGENDSGVVGQGTRDKVNAGVEFSKQLSPRGDIVADLAYLDINYNETDSTNRVDFDQTIFSAGYRFRQTERFSIRAMAGGRRYSGENDVDVDSVSGEVRAEWKWSEVTSAYLGVGYESLDATLMGQDLASSDIVPFDIGVITKSERTSYTFNIGRFARPVSTGEFRDRIRASFQWQHQLTQRVTLDVILAAYRDDELDNTDSDSSRDYFSGNLDFDWALSPRWSLGFEYFHNQQSFDGVTVSPEAIKSRDEIFVNIRFRGLDRTNPVAGGQ